MKAIAERRWFFFVGVARQPHPWIPASAQNNEGKWCFACGLLACGGLTLFGGTSLAVCSANAGFSISF